jgi:hypothetical protein
MKPVLSIEKGIYYISTSEIIEFISQNAPMDWNRCCDFTREEGIISSDFDKTYWDKKSVESYSDELKKSQKIFWIKAFFEAHPWIERMMVVFDD